MFKTTLRQQLEKYFPDKELSRWFDPLSMDMDESRGVLKVSFPHAYFGRWFMGSIRQDFERQTLSLLQNVRIIYTKTDFGDRNFLFSPDTALPSISFSQKHNIQFLPGESSFSFSGSSSVHPEKERKDLFLESPSLSPMKGYSFDNFLSNRKNDLPVAAAKECAKGRLLDSSPFILYGQSGSGKSHLLAAMANFMAVQKKPFAFGGIDYLESTNISFSAHFPLQEQAVFIDDAQRISSFPLLQESLSALIDRLYGEKKLLVLAFDIHPSLCSGLQQKLRSRLNSGLVMELKRPDLDIRTQYIERENTSHSLGLGRETILAIARRYQDIRSIDGFLAKLRFSQSITRHVTDPLELLNRDEAAGHLTHSHIIHTTSRHFSLSPEDITGKSRDRRVSLARHIAVMLCKELLGLSLVQVGRIFGGRDHSSVLHSIKRIKQLQESNKDMHKEVEKLRKLCLTRQ